MAILAIDFNACSVRGSVRSILCPNLIVIRQRAFGVNILLTLWRQQA